MKSPSSKLSFLGLLLVLAAIADISIAADSFIIVNLKTLPVPLQTGEDSNSKPGPLDGFGADYQWLAETQVGTPGQLSRQLLDTGSSNFFITTTRCDATCLLFFRGQDPVDTSQSTTFYGHPGTYTYNFGGGAAFLYNVGSDSVVLGGSSFNQSFLSATYNILGRQISFDGVLGMGPDTTTKPLGQSTTLDILKNQNKIQQRIFSVELVPARRGGGGELILGGVDYTKIKGDITWTQSTSTKLWEAKISDIAVGKNDLKIGANFIFDTGSGFILAPCQIVTPIYEALPGSRLQPNGNWTIPCKLVEEKTDFCDVKFKINNRWFSIPIIDFIVDYHIDINGKKTDYCVGAVQIHPTLIVMGVSFFKNVNVFFDQDKNNIGIAERSERKPKPEHEHEHEPEHDNYYYH